jgi:hypothetical protein
MPARPKILGTAWLRRLVAAAVLLLPAASARAVDLFEVRVTNTDGSGIPDLVVGGSSFPDLVEDLVNAQGDFAPFAGAAFSADVTFLGVPNAINITVDPATQTATLTFTALGAGAQTFVFTGTNLWDQIEQFLQDNLAQQLTAFLQIINELSLVAITDGTPLSTTALSADYVFDRFALHADLTVAERRAADAKAAETGLRARLDAFAGTIDTDVADGYSIALLPSLEWVISEDLSFGLLVPVNYTNLDGADVLNVQFDAVMPWTIVHRTPENPFNLRVAPFGTLALSGSLDLVAGGIFAGGGVLGSTSVQLGGLTVTAAGQIAWYESITLRYEGYEFDPGVSQQVAKAGVKVSQDIGEDFYVYGSYVFTSYLQSAAVDQWHTPGAGLGWRTASGLNLAVGYSADLADGYRSHNLRATLQLPF